MADENYRKGRDRRIIIEEILLDVKRVYKKYPVTKQKEFEMICSGIIDRVLKRRKELDEYI